MGSERVKHASVRENFLLRADATRGERETFSLSPLAGRDFCARLRVSPAPLSVREIRVYLWPSRLEQLQSS